MDRRTLLLAPLLALAVVPLAGCTTTKVVTAGPSADTIAVTGTGAALSKPDRVRVSFGVEVRDGDPRRAMQRVSQASNKLAAALRKAGIADKDLQTGSVRLDAQYDYGRGGPRLTGYLAGIEVSARSRDLAKTGDVIVAATEAGATRVDGIAFDLDEKNPARYAASADAIRDARAKAEAMAKAAGRTLGAVVSIGTPRQTATPETMRSAYDYAAKAAVAPEIMPGQLSAGETVEVVFALK